MKIICTKENLLSGVNKVQRAVSGKNTLPIFQGIKIQAKNNILIFEATDLEIGIRCAVPVTVLEEGTNVLPARIFSDIIRKLPDTEIRIESENHTIHIYYNDSDLILNGYDPEEFPEMSYIESENVIQIPAVLFKNMIKQTSFACAVEETRPVFTGILVEVDGETISLVGTDTHRLAYTKAVLPGNKVKFKEIIPNKAMQELNRLLDDEDILVITYNNSKVFFKFNHIELLTRLIEGQFPNYRNVIPQTCVAKLLIDKKRFSDAVERASLLGRDNLMETNTVKFEIENNKLNINQYSEAGKLFEQVEVEQEGENLSITFNARYILDLLKVIETSNVVIEPSGSFSACNFHPEDDSGYISIVLPLRN